MVQLLRQGLFLGMLGGVLSFPSAVFSQGIMVPYVGPVNRSMGGAGTATAIDAISAVYWNPASMSALTSSELSVGLDLLLPIIETGSSIAGLGGGFTSGEPGVQPLPQVGWVHKSPNSYATFGLGIISAAGVKTNYSASLTNPLFLPQSNSPGTPGGFGRLTTEAQFLQILPSVSYQLSRKLSVGFGPTLTLGKVIVDPFVFAAPDDADGSGAPTFPSGTGTRFHWGSGAQISVFYQTDNSWNMGAMVKSPQWMETFRILSEDENGAPRIHKLDVDLPMVISVGTAYTGFRNTVLALDGRYVDHKNTDFFGPQGFAPDGSLRGLGFSNSYALAAGFQHQLLPGLALRGGYTYTSSPLSDQEAQIAAAAPLFYQHTFGAGTSLALNSRMALDVAYAYALKSSLTGPLLTPFGAIPGSNVQTSLAVHDVSFGVTVRY